MKKQIMFKLIVLSFILSFGGCKSNVLIPIPINPELSKIKEFSIENGLKATVEEFTDGSYNKITLTLPSNYPLDYITPNIIISDSIREIMPKSGEKVVFEGQPPILYQLLDKKGNYQNFYLYVRRTGKLEVKFLTKEWTFDKIDQAGNVKLEIETILSKIGTNDGGTELVFFDGSGKEVNRMGGYKSSNTGNTIFNILGNFFPKAGAYTIKVIRANRESDTFPFTMKNGNVALIPKAFILPRFLKNQKIIIQGFNFNPKNQYSVTFKNDFINSAIKVPLEFIDENTLSLSIPSTFEDSDYDVDFFENNTVINSKIPDGIAVRTDDFNQYNIQIFQSNGGSSFSSFPKNFYLKGEEIESFSICCGGQLKGTEYELKLVKTDNSETYKLKGKKKNDGLSGLSWVSFKITDNTQKGSYEVYGIVDGKESLRYRKKIEIK